MPGGTAGEGEREGTVDRGPSVIALDGDPNGIALTADGLLIADDNNNRVLRFRDDDGVSKVADLPPAPAGGPGLGQIVALPDGRLVVPRFGFGSAGDVVVVDVDGGSAVVPGLDPERRRIGAAVTGDGRLFIAGFVTSGGGARIGSVWELDVDAGTEVEVLGGFEKVVGVLVVDDAVFVSDQSRGEIVRATLPGLEDPTVWATGLPSADLLSAGPDGTLFTGSKDGQVFQLDSEGAARVFVDGLQEVRGTAFDAAHDRLFVADHDGDESDGITHFLRIQPVNP